LLCEIGRLLREDRNTRDEDETIAVQASRVSTVTQRDDLKTSLISHAE
jgi:hypothetical protein